MRQPAEVHLTQYRGTGRLTSDFVFRACLRVDQVRCSRPVATGRSGRTKGPGLEPSSEPADRGDDQLGRRDKLRGSARGNRPY